MPKSRVVLGLMSGSSLDGLDLALVHFKENFFASSTNWEFLATATLPYSPEWISQLKAAPQREDLTAFSEAFGLYIGSLVNEFLRTTDQQPTLIAIHGHTAFHIPEKGYSIQLGTAKSISQVTGIACMDDFRNQDIHLGGQGAPLAPTVEHWLFPNQQAFLNIGGICNLSYHTPQRILAMDIGFGNQVLNHLAQEANQDFDEDGRIANQGKVDTALLNQVQQMTFYQETPPKSLANQWVQDQVIPLFQNSALSLADRMATAVALMAWQLQLACEQLGLKNQEILVTGGGAFNTTVVKRLRAAIAPLNNTLLIPDKKTIEFKEALLMALMAYLNVNGQNNIFCSATGSKINHCAGNLCLP